MATANITWDPTVGAVSYRVEYKLTSAPSWTLFNGSLSTTSTSIPGLVDGTAYDFRVTTNCASGSSGGVVTSGNTPCLDISGLTVDLVGTTANLQWVKKVSAVSYTIQYKLQSSPTYITATGSPLSNTGQPDPVLFSIPGLSPGVAYDFKVSVNCTVGGSPGVVVSATSACANTTNLTVTFS